MIVAMKRSSRFQVKAFVFFFLIAIGCWPAVQGPAWADEQPGSFLDSLKEELGKGLEAIRNGLGELSKDIRRLAESEEYQKLKKELDRLALEAERAGREAKEKIRNDIVPYLEEELGKLRKKLREFGREEEAEPLERRLEEIRDSAIRAV